VDPAVAGGFINIESGWILATDELIRSSHGQKIGNFRLLQVVDY
jgi:hypothetical protein